MLELLKSPEFVQVVLTILGTVWTFIRASEFYKNRVDNKYQDVINLAEDVVNKIYRIYVKPTKDADSPESPAGKLSPSEGDTARSQAVDLLKELAAKKGLDLEKIVGTNGDVEALVQKVVNEVKLRYSKK